MSEVAQKDTSKGKKKGKPKKLSTRVDFTPMVDLGFLLITFFMLATTLSKPQTMEIAMPSKDKVTEEEQTKVKASRAVTVILDKDHKVYYYEGTRENGIDPVLNQSDFSPAGIRKFLIKKNYDIMVKVGDLKAKKVAKKISEENFEKQKNDLMADKSAPIIIIKATNNATYGDLINILDEMAICNIGRYAIVDIAPFDTDLLKKKTNS
jgi:biopolymer transport protein ExbD